MTANDLNEQLPTLAILGGTGKQGPGLALRWAIAGYPIIIGSRQAEKAQATADELNARLGLASIRGMENRAAARAAEICVLTVVQTAHQEAVEGLKEALRGKILVDATARVDFRDPLPPAPPPAARYAQEKLGDEVRVVAAFQNVPASALRKNLDRPLDIDVLVCSDDLVAAQEVIRLAEAGKMRAYYAGRLDNAIVVEGITSILISLNKHYGGHSASIRVTGI
jgi:8-hydroxy-5-deazaflavin:NADPH oxidoreductase